MINLLAEEFLYNADYDSVKEHPENFYYYSLLERRIFILKVRNKYVVRMVNYSPKDRIRDHLSDFQDYGKYEDLDTAIREFMRLIYEMLKPFFI